MFSDKAVRFSAAATAFIVAASCVPVIGVSAAKKDKKKDTPHENDTAYIEQIEDANTCFYPISNIFPTAIRAIASRAFTPEIYSYTSDEHSVTLAWNGVSAADGYYLYINGDGVIRMIDLAGESTAAVIDNLSAGKEYSFRLQAYRYSSGGILKSSKGQPFSAVTAPSKRGSVIKSVTRDRENDTVTLSWNSRSTGYVIYTYNVREKKWQKAAVVKDTGDSSFTFDLKEPAPGSEIALGDVQGSEYGYRFALKSYTRDSDDKHTYWSRLSRMEDSYYDLDDLKAFFGGELQMMENVLAANYSGSSHRVYDVCTSTADENGIISTSRRSAFICDEDIAAIEKFSEEHFGEDWTDAEKLMYTVNWINKNVTYDIDYIHPGKGYADNIFTYRMGQCDSYNGTLAEMLAYWGYDGVFLQCMTNSVRFSQHLRAGIVSGGRYYTFEAGNDKRSPGWVWLIKEGMEVPFEGTIQLTPEQEEERRIKFMEDLAKIFITAEEDPDEETEDTESFFDDLPLDLLMFGEDGDEELNIIPEDSDSVSVFSVAADNIHSMIFGDGDSDDSSDPENEEDTGEEDENTSETEGSPEENTEETSDEDPEEPAETDGEETAVTETEENSEEQPEDEAPAEPEPESEDGSDESAPEAETEPAETEAPAEEPVPAVTSSNNSGAGTAEVAAEAGVAEAAI